MGQIGDRRGFSNFETDLLCRNMRAVDSICTSDEDLVQPLMIWWLGAATAAWERKFVLRALPVDYRLSGEIAERRATCAPFLNFRNCF